MHILLMRSTAPARDGLDGCSAEDDGHTGWMLNY